MIQQLKETDIRRIAKEEIRKVNHGDLRYMPDIPANNRDHDNRYYSKTVRIKKKVSIKTVAYTMTGDDEVIVCDSTLAFTVTLPAASGSGRFYLIKSINTGAITVDGNGSETIDGVATKVLAQWESVSICDYTTGKWCIL